MRAHLVDYTAGNPLALLELPTLLSTAQRAGFEALPEPLLLGRSIERIFAARVTDLPTTTQQLLLVGAAAETGNIATILRAAATFGIGPEALDDAERRVCCTSTVDPPVPAPARPLRRLPAPGADQPPGRARSLAASTRCPGPLPGSVHATTRADDASRGSTRPPPAATGALPPPLAFDVTPS